MTAEPERYARNRTNGRRGADFERRVAARLVEQGWVVVRAAGSRGACDLIAMRHGSTPLLVQCKLDRHALDVPEWHALWALSVRTGSRPLVADRQGLWLVIGDRPAYGRIDQWLTAIGWDE